MSHSTRRTYLAFRYYTIASRRAFHAGMTDTAKLAWNRAVTARRSIYAPALILTATATTAALVNSATR